VPSWLHLSSDVDVYAQGWEVYQKKETAKKLYRRDRGDLREKHFILKNLCVLCALSGE